MAKCWMHMVGKRTAAWVVDLACCVHMSSRGNGVHSVMPRLYGTGGATPHVLDVTNQGQCVPKRVKEGMKGRSFGLASNPPPSGWGGGHGRGTTADIFCVR